MPERRPAQLRRRRARQFRRRRLMALAGLAAVLVVVVWLVVGFGGSAGPGGRTGAAGSVGSATVPSGHARTANRPLSLRSLPLTGIPVGRWVTLPDPPSPRVEGAG